ncbi:MAG: phenylalanine--tRNA ligase subunit beta [Gammaproteobacteria bacterium]|nr:MAG: phenylalanine--tRNA ligase subunit beta [Gammaproteobacteria bacterium]RLA23187.1 MAG: phenylalanine--tRNA ligase subunit beta [Gammaproteobacteria bacterium]
MHFSEAWLREIVNPSINTKQLVEQLTMAGLEVEGVEPAAADFSQIVVGEVVEIAPHPDADKLQVCKVSSGTEQLQIVCGARNVAVGMKVPLALIGAVLPGDFKIKKSKLRGVESFGMLCSDKELGMAESADGLMALPNDAPVGKDIREYLQLNDNIIEVDLTPNRADCLSLEGVAREVGLLNKIDCQFVQSAEVKIEIDQTLSVSVEAVDQCPVYLGRVISDLDASRQTPLWMQERLRRAGLRSLGPVVDVTNYVLLELGQPLHAFDAEKLSGGINVRMGRDDEKLLLLNDQEILLDKETLVIADESKPLALAGIMGGADSAVSSATTSIFLECAFFTPLAMMGKARKQGLHTDSSHRFERGVDPELQLRALERATGLILDIAGGKAGAIVQQVSMSNFAERKQIPLRKERINRLLGVAIEASEIEDIFQRLGMHVEVADDGWVITPPGFRFDIAIEADLIEELGRVYGYDRLPRRSLMMRSDLKSKPESLTELDRIRDLLVDRGYQEAITYSFVDEALQKKLVPGIDGLKLKNPLSSELSVMRTTLWAGLLRAAERNLNRQQARVQIFEAGLKFLPEEDGVIQERYIAGLLTGSVAEEQWGEKLRSADFYDIKSDVEAILNLSGSGEDFRFEEAKHPALHPGQSAQIVDKEGLIVGWVGLLHPVLEKELGFDKQLFLFELKESSVANYNIPAFKPLSKFPQVRRDIAVIVDEAVSYASLRDCVNNLKSSAIKDLIVFDVYRGEGVESGRKSVALSLILQDSSKTLVDADIDAIVSQALDALEKELDAKLRD